MQPLIQWLSQPARFEAFTTVLQQTLSGQGVPEHQLPTDSLSLSNAVQKSVFETTTSITCQADGCTDEYSPLQLPVTCACGNELTPETTDSTTWYQTQSYPEVLEPLMEPAVAGYRLSYTATTFDETVSALNPLKGELPNLHISPFFSFSDPVQSTPGYADLFLDWKQYPELVTCDDPDAFIGELEQIARNQAVQMEYQHRA